MENLAFQYIISHPYLLYTLVFLLVFVPYVLMQMYLQYPDVPTQKEMKEGLPSSIRCLFGVAKLFSDSLGKTLVSLSSRRHMEELERQLTVANLKVRVEFVLTAQVMGCLLCGILFLFFSVFVLSDTMLSLLMGVCGLALGWCLPAMQVAAIATRRQKAIIKELPFAIDLMSAAMNAGLDFVAALRYYIENCSDSPLVQEFSLVQRDMGLGKSRVEAMEAMAKRVCLKEFSIFSDAIVFGTEVGASISETITKQGEEIRRRRFVQAEEQAVKAAGIMILPIALFILPAFFIMLAVPLYVQYTQSGM